MLYTDQIRYKPKSHTCFLNVWQHAVQSLMAVILCISPVNNFTTDHSKNLYKL